MVDARSRNPADLIKYYSELIMLERRKIEEALSAISEYAEQLGRVTNETQQRMLTRE